MILIMIWRMNDETGENRERERDQSEFSNNHFEESDSF